MRYQIAGIELRTENAAKPHTQQSTPVAEYLKTKGSVSTLLDFGCGKLRYSDILVSIAESTTFVDSEIQLSRLQSVRGIRTSVKEYVKANYQNCQTLSLEDISAHRMRYDLITCTNVISAIPCKQTLSSSLLQIKNLLKYDGVAIFINQHRSSYFKKYESGKKHMYGYLYQGRRGASYYGIMCRQTMSKLLTENGLTILKSWNQGESNFIEAAKAANK